MDIEQAKELIDAGYFLPTVGWNEGWFYKGRYYDHNLPTLLNFISSLLQDQRQRMAEEIEGAKVIEEKEKWMKEQGSFKDWYEGYYIGLEAALNIVLGERENHD